MSGGVDSSVAALLLKKKGHEVAGITMDLHKPSGGLPGNCGSSRAASEAERVCAALGIPHITIDCSGHFERTVVSYFLHEYRNGRTPNPCIACNRDVKFGLLLHKAVELGYDFLATGHYANRDTVQGRPVIRRARDSSKDQSYFLYAIATEALNRILFPLGSYTKKQVRMLAHEEDLPVADSPDSQDICFIPDGDYRKFIASRLEHSAPGVIVDQNGAILGTHRGISFYTIGQRSGLGIAAPAPLYVIGIDPERNRIVVGSKPAVRSRRLTASRVHVHAPCRAGRNMAKIRYAHAAAPCSVTLSVDTMVIEFDEPQEAITPGQSVVVYDGDMIACGGVIDTAGP